MENSTHSTQSIRVPVETVSLEELVRRLAAENGELRQTLELKDAQIDELTNTVVILKELVQQLRDEIAVLKGQKPKPEIQPSHLEGSQKKLNWQKRFQRYSGKEKPILFSFWVKISYSSHIPLPIRCFRAISSATGFQVRAVEISRLGRSVIKNVRRVGKRGQPRGKPRKKKKTILEIHEKSVIQPLALPEGVVFKGYRPYTVQNVVFKPHNTQY